MTEKPVLVKSGEGVWLSADFPAHRAKEDYHGIALETQQLHSRSIFVRMALPPDSPDGSGLYEEKRVLFPVNIIQVDRKDPKSGRDMLVNVHVPDT